MMMGRQFHLLFVRDLKYSLRYGKYKYLIFAAILVILVIVEGMKLKQFNGNSVDVIHFLLKDNGYIFQFADYHVPINWVFIQFVTLFLIGDFLIHDNEKNKSYVLLRIYSKGQYISSKLCWILIQSIFLFVMIFTVIYIVSALTLGNFMIEPSAYFLNAIEPNMNHSVAGIEYIFRIFIGYILTSTVLSSILLLSLQFISPITAFFGVIVLSAISTFSDLKWLPAIHSMIMRQAIFDGDHNLTLFFSVCYLSVLFAIISLCTLVVFKKRDII